MNGLGNVAIESRHSNQLPVIALHLDDYFPPAGARRRSSSKKFSRNVKCVGGFCALASSSARIAAIRLPSGARSYREASAPMFSRRVSDHTRGLPRAKESPLAE